ncbi:hypothetical protein FN846DRAFT_939523 [Sphaerosporella brunnea]|uniref:WW-domain-binding protein n=1 Tax=Sphaerosporella brunnea TaxID=1250544 RepID=A0A5J5F2T6_9PEZI|nr:hypothetical protein FN846DRAFT_939523 [Sphaerosporella brunnea]
MSLNWVMLGPQPHTFVPLANERTLYTSPGRTTFALSGGVGNNSFKFASPAGVVIITNQRVLYLPTTRTPEFESFSAPILHLQDSRVSAPFFGANYWTCNVQPVASGNIPPCNTAIELKLVFKDAGAFDFSTTFERVKERVAQAVENSGSTGSGAEVHLEDLPAYEDPPPPIDGATTAAAPPNEAPPGYEPPGYEEVQRESVERAAAAREVDGEDFGRKA